MIGGGGGEPVVTTYKADVSQHRAQVEALRASQQALSAEILKGLESQNKGLESSIAKWAKVGVVVGAAVAATKVAADAWKAYVDRSNAQAATYGVSLEALRKASAGLKTDTELLNFAERQLSKDLVLTRGEMELVLKAQVALARNGRDAAKVEEAVGAALQKNTVKPLKEIGILLKQNEDPAKNFAQIMRALATAASDAGAAQAEVGENVQRAGVAIQNSWSDVQVAAGRLIDQGLSPLAGALTGLLDVTNDFLKRLFSAPLDDQDAKNIQGLLDDNHTVGGAVHRARLAREGTKWRGDDVALGQWQGMVNTTLRNMAGIQKDVASMAARASAFRRTTKGRGDNGASARELEALTNWDLSTGRYIGEGELGGVAGDGAFGGSIGDFRGRLNAFQEEGSREERYQAFKTRDTDSKLAKIFGPIEEFQTYQKAWGLLEDSVTSALDAWITGAEPATKAIKRVVAESLRTWSIELAVRALRAGAFAVGALATYNYPQAALHAKEAALSAAGSAAAAAGAKLLGGTGATGIPTGAGAAPVTPPPVAQPQQAAPVVVVYGDSFASLTDRKRAQEARRIIASGVDAANQGVTFR